MKFLSALLLLSSAFSLSALAQHEHHMPDADSPHDTSAMFASHAYSRNLPMSRNGSGTSWMPDSSPMYMYMIGNEKSNWMFHGSVFLRYTKQDLFNKGSRGDVKFDAPNMFMAMYNRQAGEKGLFSATGMISFDPFTVGKSGYPLLYQSGETYKDEKLVDRQHPHDLFSALSVAYTYSFDKDKDLTVYAGYPGEPALGPVAFMHRISALNNPDAPLGHHWQDATHISFGVSTIGFRFGKVKLEGSVFNGHEPDEHRYNFDKPRFNSYSYRLSYNPTANLAIQLSQGHLKEPEALEPGIDVVRTTVSLSQSHAMRTMSWSQTLIWGMNRKSGDGSPENAFLYENNLQFRTQAIYSRYEFINKSSEELNLDAHYGIRNFNIQALTIGYNHRVAPASPVEISAGIQSTFNFSPAMLQSLYGKTPIGFQIYLQVRPHRHE